MKYEYAERADNVYVIDTMMFDFEHYSSAFLVEGKELAIVDTGLPAQLPALISGIKKHGFSPSDISYIFVTHCEHPDHSGNIGPLLKMSPKAKAYINPIGLQALTDFSIERNKWKATLPPHMFARFGEMEPVPRERVRFLSNNEVIDLGDDVRLKFIFAKGHQPSGLVIVDEKNKGLFINDLVGNYFADADFSLILSPPRSDLIQCAESLRMLKYIPTDRLYLGHYGICGEPQTLIERALTGIGVMMEIGAKCVAEGKPEEIKPRIEAIKLKEAEKILPIRGEKLYKYLSEELIVSQGTVFSEYYLKLWS